MSLVTSVMELHKIPDLFHLLFSYLYKLINLSNKIDSGGVLVNSMNMDGGGTTMSNPNTSSNSKGQFLEYYYAREKASDIALKSDREAAYIAKLRSDLSEERSKIQNTTLPQTEELSRREKLVASLLAKRDKDGKALYDAFYEASINSKDECSRLTARVKDIDSKGRDYREQYLERIEYARKKRREVKSFDNNINSLSDETNNNNN